MGDLLGYLLLNLDFHINEDTPDGEKSLPFIADLLQHRKRSERNTEFIIGV